MEKNSQLHCPNCGQIFYPHLGSEDYSNPEYYCNKCDKSWLESRIVVKANIKQLQQQLDEGKALESPLFKIIKKGLK